VRFFHFITNINKTRGFFMNQVNKSKLFTASCMALLVTSLSFGIRAGILTKLGAQFSLSTAELSAIASTAFWGFPLSVIIGGMVVDKIGMKRLLSIGFVLHLLGIVMTIFANGYWALFLSTLCVGLANGIVEAACNPLIATIYSDRKTAKLNHFHLWFPGGIVIGTLIGFSGMDWQLQMALMLIPTFLYGYLFYQLAFPVTERVASGVSDTQMYEACLKPLFLFMIVCMFGTAITELFTGQWIEVLLKSVNDNAILILTVTALIMVIGRGFAEPIVQKLSASGVLLISAVLATLGMYVIGHSTGNTVFVGAVLFGMGVCYFWPTMLGYVAENMPKTGAVGLNLMGGAGMFAVSIYTMFMGKHYDSLLLNKLPSGADLAQYSASDATAEMQSALATAKIAAGPEVINFTMMIPAVLILAFAVLYFNRHRFENPAA
jgi:MFS family permease